MQELCVVGRCDFNSGIGKVTLGALLSLGRFYSISIFPLEHHLRALDFISIPGGGRIAVCKNLDEVRIAFFTDVLWNGAADLNYLLLPRRALKIAHIAWDSDVFPAQWVEILNSRCDLALFTSRHLERIAKAGGVKIPVGTLPVALDIDALISSAYQFRHSDVVTYGSLSSFHPRKGVDTLIRAFLRAFKASPKSAKLILHSNVRHESLHRYIQDMVSGHPDFEIILSYGDLAEREKNDLVASFDIYVSLSQGEGYSIGPREAMAMGKPLILSDVAAHRDMIGVDGVFSVCANEKVPARYPEIDGLVFGYQHKVSHEASVTALAEAARYLAEGRAQETAAVRKKHARNFSVSYLAPNYAEILNPWLRLSKRRLEGSRYFHGPKAIRDIVAPHVGEYFSRCAQKTRIVVPAHDGGFFSVFNAFFSNLVWNLRVERCHMTLPDWDVGRLIDRAGTDKLTSFCYAAPSDGNVWTKIFKPLYGLTEWQMNDRDFLYSGSVIELDPFNGRREPNLTYINAAKLYSSPEFDAIRRMYHAVFSDLIVFNGEIQADVERFAAKNFSGKYVVAAHVKHPSHVIEQPGGVIAGTAAYIREIREHLNEVGLLSDEKAWAIFLATDQDLVVSEFRREFGGNVCFFEDVRRTTLDEDRKFNALECDARAREGYQVQHLVAADPDSWSARMAIEVVRDAATMARAKILFHVVSNVSTAVSYMNPKIELRFARETLKK